MTFISYFRFRILKKPLNEKRINRRAILKSCLFCVFLSLFWSSAPLLGWSYYSLEDSLVSCSVEYNEKSFNVTSYNIGMFIFVFIIPFIIIIFSNVKSILIVIFLKPKLFLILLLI